MPRPSLLAPQLDFERESTWKRPLIIPQGGGAPISNRRTTTYVGVVEDMYNLQRWERRMDALGLADRPDLLLRVQAHRDDKNALNDICYEAKKAGIIASGTNTPEGGTALHALTDMIDRGEDLPRLAPGPLASLEAFKIATAPLVPKAIEMRCVMDVLQVAGTADRLYAHGQGSKQRLYIGDTKSGTIELGILKIAMQLAMYSRSRRYDVKSGEREAHGADTQRGIVMHMPQTTDPAEAKCELFWIDIEAGWNEVKTARDIWHARSARFKDLCEPFVDTQPLDIGLLIAGAKTSDEVREIYREHRDVWSADLNTLAQMRATELDSQEM